MAGPRSLLALTTDKVEKLGRSGFATEGLLLFEPLMSASISTLPTQASFYPSLAAVSAADWAELFPGKGEDWAYFRTLEAAPPPGF